MRKGHRKKYKDATSTCVVRTLLCFAADFSRQVLQIVGHGNCIAVAYNHCVCVLSAKECRGWDLVFTSPPLERVPQRIALTTRPVGGASGAPILAVVLGTFKSLLT